MPYPVVIRFGPPLPADQATVENLRGALLAMEKPSDPVNAPPVPEPPKARQPRRWLPRRHRRRANRPARPLLDLDAQKFSARPEFAGHLAESIVRALKDKGAQEAVVDYSGDHAQRVSGDKLLAIALALAQRLRRNVPEPRVGIVLPPSLGGLIANYAVMLAGKTPVNLNFTIGKAALEHSLRKSGVNTTITDKVFREKITGRIPDLPWSERVLDLREEIAALSKFALFGWWLMAKFSSVESILRRADVPREGGDREAALLFTSGSSGEPKGVVLTHRNILGNCAQIDASDILPAEETLLANLPIFHSFGFTIILWYALQRGLRVVTVPSPLDVHKCLEAISSEKATVLLGTPTFFRPYLKRAEPAQLVSVKFVVAGAEKTPAGFHEEWEKRFGSQYCEGYGLTETSPVVAVNLPAAPGRKPRIRREEKTPRLRRQIVSRLRRAHRGPRHRRGQGLQRRRHVVSQGREHFPRLPRPARQNGGSIQRRLVCHRRFGAVGRGRLSLHRGPPVALFKIGGEMIPHGTVEAAVMEALGLKAGDAPTIAIAARPDAAKGEALVLLTTKDLNAEELRGKLSAKGLANLWLPRIIKKVDAIPMLGSGKLDLKKLKELAKE